VQALFEEEAKHKDKRPSNLAVLGYFKERNLLSGY
jgi:hypothetical protein